MSRLLLLFLRAVTPVHAGMGRGYLEHVDLPHQRDEFGMPCIWGSSVKGAFKSAVRGAGDAGCVKACLGPDPGDLEVREYSSAVSFLDARLLLVPARSLRGIWAYVTTPHLLGYLAEYLEALGPGWEARSKALRSIKPRVSSTDRVLIDSKAFLSEVEVRDVRVDGNALKPLLDLLPKGLREKVEERGVVVVDDDEGKRIITRSMMIQYRVRLSRATKTVEEGPWTEEYLPQEAVLVTGVRCTTPTKARDECRDCCEWLVKVLGKLNYGVWLGGKETIGRGLLKVYVERDRS